jgi:putative Ca2+/H+ antiporter (TMEM165/GDT1 family)
MAWIGAEFAALLPRRAGQMLVAFALVIAAAELGWPLRPAPPKEPPRSLAAFAVVLFARQIGDAARFALFALATWTISPGAAGLGGALGGAAAVGLGWAAGPTAMARWPLRHLRIVLASALGIAALFIGIDARFGA